MSEKVLVVLREKICGALEYPLDIYEKRTARRYERHQIIMVLLREVLVCRSVRRSAGHRSTLWISTGNAKRDATRDPRTILHCPGSAL